MKTFIFSKRIVLLGTNILFFIFAYNLFRCAYCRYAIAKGTEIKNVGEVISAYAQKAFYFLILFIILKPIVLLVFSYLEKKKE